MTRISVLNTELHSRKYSFWCVCVDASLSALCACKSSHPFDGFGLQEETKVVAALAAAALPSAVELMISLPVSAWLLLHRPGCGLPSWGLLCAGHRETAHPEKRCDQLELRPPRRPGADGGE